MKVISAAAAVFYGTPDPLPPVSTMSYFGEQHQMQTGSGNLPKTGSTNKL